MASPVIPARPWTTAVKPTTAIQDQSDKVQNVQARVVQHHYVRAELRDINMRKGGGLIQATLDALKRTPQGKKCSKAQLMEGYQHMTRRLQMAELTINIKSESWFTNPNNYDSYTQMYERGVRTVTAADGSTSRQMRLQNTALNPAANRVDADEKVTFRRDMKSSGQFKPEFGGMGRVMSPGTLNAPTVDARPGEYEASNPYFNPKSKQVFAALNYGRRPHGATTTYGFSYLILNPKLKTNAIYFAGDTFGIAAGYNVSADDQVSYDLLGAVYPKAQPVMQQDLYRSCILDGTLQDADPGHELTLLLEAHLFEPLTFAGNLEKIVLSPREKPDSAPLTGDLWQTIQTNARTFARKHGAKLVFTD